MSSNKLANIDENGPSNWLPSSVHPPETPTESLEFLARSWSLSATELSKALTTSHVESNIFDKDSATSVCRDANDVLNNMHFKDTIKLRPSVESPPVSPVGSDDTKELFLLHQALQPSFLYNQQLLKTGLAKNVVKGKSMGCWSKEQKERKKHEVRTHNAQLHAAVSVAGVAAAVAALTASHASLTENSSVNMKSSSTMAPLKMSAAIASAAALVASHCIEIAEEMGADHHQILTVVDSAVNARTNGDIMSLTAGAATALRAASTLKVRLQIGNGAPILALADDDGKELSMGTAMNFVSRGGELLKRTRKGDLHWKQVSFRVNPAQQVVVKLKSKHVGGTFTKKKKEFAILYAVVVSGVYPEIPAWPGREKEDYDMQREYFGIQINDRIIEFECKNKAERQIWTDGIQHIFQTNFKATKISSTMEKKVPTFYICFFMAYNEEDDQAHTTNEAYKKALITSKVLHRYTSIYKSSTSSIYGTWKKLPQSSQGKD
ncbi:hypothetical protein V2J09_005276 [Rumex salicifolius]